MSTVSLRLPLPPSVNALYANVPGRGRVKSQRYRTWINAAGHDVRAQKPAKVAGEYRLWLHAERPDRRRRDLANLVKAVEDLLVEHGVVEDDSLCSEVHLYWSGTGRSCTVEVAPLHVAMARAA